MPNPLKKTLLIIGFVLFYFLGIREVRGVVNDTHFEAILQGEYGELSQSINFYSRSTVSFVFEYEVLGYVNKSLYKISFGMFFLFAIIGMIIIHGTRSDYIYLIGIHFIGGLLSLIFMILGISINQHYLIVPDILSRYLIPLLSLGLVVLRYSKKKSNLTDEK